MFSRDLSACVGVTGRNPLQDRHLQLEQVHRLHWLLRLERMPLHVVVCAIVDVPELTGHIASGATLWAGGSWRASGADRAVIIAPQDVVFNCGEARPAAPATRWYGQLRSSATRSCRASAGQGRAGSASRCRPWWTTRSWTAAPPPVPFTGKGLETCWTTRASVWGAVIWK